MNFELGNLVKELRSRPGPVAKTNIPLPDSKGGFCAVCGKEIGFYETQYQSIDPPHYVYHTGCKRRKAPLLECWLRFDG